MLLSNDAKQIAESHFLCVFILTEAGDGSARAPGRGDRVRVMRHPGLHRNLLCTAQWFGVPLVPPDSNPVSSFSFKMWKKSQKSPHRLPRTWWKGGAVGWVAGGDVLAEPHATAGDTRDSCAQGLVLRLRCPNVWQVDVRLHLPVAF